MAPDPSSGSHYNRSHARKPTAVALPLSLTDKHWRRPSKAPAYEPEKPSTPGSQAQSEQQDEISQNAPVTSPSEPAEVSQDSRELVSPQSEEDRHVSSSQAEANENQSTIGPVGGTTLSLSPDVPVTSSEGTPQPESETPAPEAESQQVVEPPESQHSDIPPAASPDEVYLNGLNDDAVNGDHKVRLAEEDIQPSENDASSVEPSNTTAITDYGSTAGESTLETVVDDSYHVRKPPGIQHRQSEAAPEALINGFTSHAVNRSVSSQASPIPIPKPAPVPSIQEHLLFLASTKQYFDTIIYVNHPDQSYQPSEHFGHSLFLSRSGNLAKLITDADTTIQPKVLNFYPARNVLPHAFEAALRFFYSDHVLTTSTLVPQGAYHDKQTKEQTLEYVMSYWIAGVELGLLPVKARAFEMVQEMAGWDVAEMLAKEAQDLRVAETTQQSTIDKFEVLDIAESLSRLLAQLFVTQLDVKSFSVDSNAHLSTLPARFAQLEYPRTNNPALSSVVFGSLPTSGASSPLPQSTASAILLNVSFIILSRIAKDLTMLHGADGERLLRQVIELREEKRGHVITNRAVPNRDRLGNSTAWDAAGFREYVNEYGQLDRERVGYLLPTRNR